LGYEDVGDFVVDVGSEEEDAVFEEAGDYVDLAGAAFDCGEGGWGAGAFWCFFWGCGLIGHHRHGRPVSRNTTDGSRSACKLSNSKGRCDGGDSKKSQDLTHYVHRHISV